MYSPLIEGFNYALWRLSKFDVPGLPKFQEEHQIVFARSDAKSILSESSSQGSYKPDILLLKWTMFKQIRKLECPEYAISHWLDVCCKSGDTPDLGWHNILSTVEVKCDSTTRTNKGRLGTGNFGDLQGDLGALQSSKFRQSAPAQKIAKEVPTICSRMSVLLHRLSSRSHQP